jgi:acetamidase/formamidase
MAVAFHHMSPTPDHILDDRSANIHYSWDPSLDPVLTVEPGDMIRFECRDATDGQLGPGSTTTDVERLDFQGHPLTSPVHVDGLESGDTLAIDIISLEHHGIGYTYFYPGSEGKGLLPAEFDEPGLHVWELEDNKGSFVDGIEVPLAPFPGNLGVPPADPGSHSTVPPRTVGGNLDIKHLTAGSRLFLPVAVDGGLFSIGDCHAVQGDGEVCITGIEAPMDVTIRLDVRSDLTLSAPRFETAGPFSPSGSDEPMVASVGIADDLMVSTKSAIRGMLDYLETERELTRSKAYLLCSVAVDLKINEVVDAPNWVVSAYLAEGLFPD